MRIQGKEIKTGDHIKSEIGERLEVVTVRRDDTHTQVEFHDDTFTGLKNEDWITIEARK